MMAALAFIVAYTIRVWLHNPAFSFSFMIPLLIWCNLGNQLGTHVEQLVYQRNQTFLELLLSIDSLYE
jgi:tryptophan-rich sensory protein